MENLTALQDLADQINADAGAASPQYVAYLVEGNDVGGILNATFGNVAGTANFTNTAATRTGSNRDYSLTGMVSTSATSGASAPTAAGACGAGAGGA